MGFTSLSFYCPHKANTLHEKNECNFFFPLTDISFLHAKAEVQHINSGKFLTFGK